MKSVKRSTRPLRVFEAFAGIGAQHAALKRLGLNFEIVGVSEWFVDALECYEALHGVRKDIPVPEDREDLLACLSRYTFSQDSVHPCELDRMSTEELSRLFFVNKSCKNYGSITQIKPENMPLHDLLVYSFPCQDLSTGGKCLGMKKGSGTRSGLLWEIQRILKGLADFKRLPEYLLMENVTTISADSNIKDLKKWLSFLESIGYQNDECHELNAQDFGIPQDRTRAFILSHLGRKISIGKDIEKLKVDRKFDIHKFIMDDYSNPTYKREADEAQLNKTPSRETMWKINGMQISDSTIVRTITCNMDRTHCAALFPYDGILGKSYRRPTMREAFLLMGFTNEDYEKAAALGYSYRKMNKLIGNSIVVNVLEAIFRALFAEKYSKEV